MSDNTSHDSTLVDLNADVPDAAPLKKLGLALAVGAVVVAGAGIAWRHHSAASEEGVAAGAAIADVAVVHPAASSGDDEIVLPGQVQAWNNAAINARTSGYVKTWLADIGSPVHTGQPLAVLDAPEVDQQLAQAEADYQTALANQNLSATTSKRWTTLLKQDAVSQQETDEKQGDLAAKIALSKAALANVKRLKATQGFETVYAPFDGIITSRSAQIGALVTTGNPNAQPLFTVSDVHRIRVYVRVPQNYSAMLHTGISASLVLPEYPNHPFTAELTRSAGAVDTQSGSVLVELQSDNSDRMLKPGAFAQVHFHAPGSSGSLTLPGSAILYGTDGPSVAVATGMTGPNGTGQATVAIRPVKITRDDGNIIHVTGPFGPGDAVIDSPPDAIHAGQTVRVTETMAPAKAAPSAAKGAPNAQ
jgi:RND family efflux transporter MFP subunit